LSVHVTSTSNEMQLHLSRSALARIYYKLCTCYEHFICKG